VLEELERMKQKLSTDSPTEAECSHADNSLPSFASVDSMQGGLAGGAAAAAQR
jgi:hypothetical protein